MAFHDTVDQSQSQRKELAKRALLSLFPHGIRYGELVHEGIDPIILQQLYDEIGIKKSTPDVRPADLSTAAFQRDSCVGDLTEETVNGQKPSVPKWGETPHGSSGLNRKQNSDESTIKPQKTSEQLKACTISASDPKPPSQVSKISASSHPISDSVNKLSAAMERKDRIAQLLAAKAGRPAPARSGVPSESAPSDGSNLPNAAVISTASPAPISATTLQQNAKASKSQAKTDLVRQKMEALKKTAMEKAGAQKKTVQLATQELDKPAEAATSAAPTSPMEKPALSSSALDIRPASFPTVVSTQGESLSPSHRTSVLTQQSLLGRIPGLFMTAAETTDIGKKDGIKAELSPAPTHPPADFNLSLGERALNRTVQKRPLASDSFDEPLPPAKRPFGITPSIEHAGTPESEPSGEGSEGVGMDIDEDSQTSEGAVIDTNVTGKVPGQSKQAPLAVSEPEHSPTATAPTTGILNVVAPTRKVSKEELYRAKNQEIEEMRRKIAEMEKRQQAKRSLDLMRSGRSSTPVTPKAATAPTQSYGFPVLSSSPTKHASSTDTIDPGVDVKYAMAGTHQGDDSRSMSSSPRPILGNIIHGDDLRRKIARRKQLEDGLPELNEEVRIAQMKMAEAQDKLAAMRKEAEQREAETREAKKREAEVAEEVRMLEEQLQKGLSGRDRYSEEMQNLSAGLGTLSPAEPESSNQGTEKIDDTQSDLRASAVASPENESTPNSTSGSPSCLNCEMPDDMAPFAPAQSLGSLQSPTVIVEENQTSFASELQHLESISPSDVEEQLHSRGAIDEERHGDDSDQFFAVPENVTYPREQDEDSASMSDSASGEYEPAEGNWRAQQPDGESDVYEPVEDHAPARNHSQEFSDIDDDYEPAEVIVPMDINILAPTPESAWKSSTRESGEPGAGVQTPSSLDTSKHSDGIVAMDTEAGLELSEANTLTKTQEIDSAADNDAQSHEV